MTATLSRNVPIDPAHAALLFIDVQTYALRADASPYFRQQMQDVAIPNMQRVQAACRDAGIEVLYTVIQNLTVDGRDRSLDYKISGINVPRGSPDGLVLDAIAPAPDEIVLPKTSSSVFISTNVDYLLRNLGVRSLMLAGVLTDQCVDSAIRDACDLGYLVTAVTDACATHSQERHDWAFRNNAGYCRQITTAALVAEIERLSRRQLRAAS